MPNPCFVHITPLTASDKNSSSFERLLSFFKNIKTQENIVGGVQPFSDSSPVYDIVVSDDEIQFYQPWKPCKELLITISRLLPDVVFQVQFAEPCNSLYGRWTLENGGLKVCSNVDQAFIDTYCYNS